MTRKCFCIVSILAIVLVAIFVLNEITQAQRPDRSDMRERGRGGRGGPGGPGGMRGFSPTSIIDSTWVDLTFEVKVDDETLLKARPVFQKHREKLAKAVKEAMDSGDFQSMRLEMAQLRDAFATERNALLTEEQISKLEALEAKRIEQMMRRGGRGAGRRGGGGPPR